MSSRRYRDRPETAEPPDPAVEVTEFGGIRVAYVPGDGEAWISGWVDVPR